MQHASLSVRSLLIALLMAPLMAPLITPAAFAQTPSPDSQLTQALLAEIRQLRQDLQTTAVTIQRVQIVMYRLQFEANLSSRATQRLDEARTKLATAQSQRKMFAAEIERTEEKLRNTQNPSERKGPEEILPRLKASLEMFTNEEQQWQAKEAEAESQFRAQQAKMNELQDQLDKLDKTLDSYNRK